jgi:carbon storage regulator
MLVLSRKVGQAIVIGDGIVVRVTEIRGKGPKALVKLGIEAPLGTRILREEVEREVAQEMMLAKDPAFDIDSLKNEFSKGDHTKPLR